jgi:predicted PolB exonuclease-like 3'-5' exonuclease
METKWSPFDIVFIDIETVPAYSGIEKLPEQEKMHWFRKEKQLTNHTLAEPGSLYQRAGIYAEFGKIVCICAGRLIYEEGVCYLLVKTFHHRKEVDLLNSFSDWLNEQAGPKLRLCAHNGKEFDFPYLCRRMLIHGVQLPDALNLAGKKPWEIMHLDTLELWKFGDYKHYTSLDLLAHTFGIPSPKAGMDGSQVSDYYYRKSDITSIRKYCENDIWTLAAVFLHMTGQRSLLPQHLEVQRMC